MITQRYCYNKLQVHEVVAAKTNKKPFILVSLGLPRKKKTEKKVTCTNLRYVWSTFIKVRIVYASVDIGFGIMKNGVAINKTSIGAALGLSADRTLVP